MLGLGPTLFFEIPNMNFKAHWMLLEKINKIHQRNDQVEQDLINL